MCGSEFNIKPENKATFGIPSIIYPCKNISFKVTFMYFIPVLQQKDSRADGQSYMNSVDF